MNSRLLGPGMGGITPDTFSDRFQRIVCEKLRLGFQERLGREFINSLSIEETRDLASNDLIVRLTGYILSREVREEANWAKTETITTHSYYPKTWWDHAKETISNRFPWLGRYLKVELTKFTEITRHIYTADVAKFYRTCPHLPSDPQRDHVMFLASDRETLP